MGNKLVGYFNITCSVTHPDVRGCIGNVDPDMTEQNKKGTAKKV